MHRQINKVAVLGAGTMGARISAHLANAGVPSYLFDIVPPDADGPARNRIAAAGLEAAVKSSPPLSSSRRSIAWSPSATSRTTCRSWPKSTGSSRRSSKTWRSSASCCSTSKPSASRERSSPPTPAACPWPRSPKASPRTSAAAGSARTSSIRRATCGCWN